MKAPRLSKDLVPGESRYDHASPHYQCHFLPFHSPREFRRSENDKPRLRMEVETRNMAEETSRSPVQNVPVRCIYYSRHCTFEKACAVFVTKPGWPSDREGQFCATQPRGPRSLRERYCCLTLHTLIRSRAPISSRTTPTNRRTTSLFPSTSPTSSTER